MSSAAPMDWQLAKAVLSHFSPDEPLIVSPTVMADLEAEPEMAGMLDRVRASEEMPQCPSV